GSEVRMGQVVLEAGRYLAPADLGVLASFGKATARVFRRPSTAVLSTGDELVEVERVPGPGEIRNINAYSLSAALRSMSLDAQYLGIGRDDKADLRSKIARGLERDVLIMSGGVSMGRYDFVKEIFEEMGVKIFFEKVAMRPGKPTVFGRRRDGVVFGLPGNPVSCLVAFENFIRPALWKMMGAEWSPKRLRAELTREIKQKPDREAYLPAWTYWRDGRWFLDPIPHKGSADIVAFSRANSMLVFPRGAERYAAGTQIEAVLLDEFIRK
ncbi:MAG: molybdopterin molybdotransferase MoeA, partial [Acidobacteria bacterium]|nr:molybdopterin molybdotransferase MoeA [Acidobacteriota bacterium]